MIKHFGAALLLAAAGGAQAQAADPDFVYSVYLESMMVDALPIAEPGAPVKAGNPGPLREHHHLILEQIKTSGGRGQSRVLPLFWETAGPVLTVGPTRHRVKGSDPKCTDKKRLVGQRDPDVEHIATAVQGAAAALDAATLGIPVFSALSAVAFAAVLNNNTYQTHANCSMTCALVPAAVQKDQMSFKTLFAVGDGQLTERATGGYAEWSRLEEPIIDSKVLELPNGSARLSEGPTCKSKLVCMNVMNWSAHRPIRAQLVVQFDAVPEQSKEICVDPSMVAKSYRAAQHRAMDRKQAKDYLEKWFSGQAEVLQQPPP